MIPVSDPVTRDHVFEIRPKGSETARFIVEPDWTQGYVGRVRSRDPAVRGPDGERLGKTPLSALPAAARALCRDEAPDLLVCPDPLLPTKLVRAYDAGPAPVLVELRYLADVP